MYPDALYDIDSLKLYKGLLQAQEIQLKLFKSLTEHDSNIDAIEELRETIQQTSVLLDKMISPSQRSDV